MVSTESDLIDALGGTNAVAALCEVKHNTVSSWRTRGFPPWAIGRLQTESAERGIDAAPTLFEIRRPQRVA